MIYNQENCQNILTAVIQLVKPQLNVALFFWKIHLLYINCKYKVTTKNIYRSLTDHVASDRYNISCIVLLLQTYEHFKLAEQHSNLVWAILKFVRTWYLKERNFRLDLFSRVIFLIFRVDLISRIGYRWIFREDLFSQILVLSMFYIFWFFRDLFSARTLVMKLLPKFADISSSIICI